MYTVEFQKVLVAGFESYGADEKDDNSGKWLPSMPGVIEDSVQLLLDELERLRQVSGQQNATVLITIDQFEEVFGDIHDDPTEQFVQLLAGLLEQEDVPLMVLGTLRSDFFETFQMHPVLQNVSYDTLKVGPMTPENIAQVIQKPAELAGVELEAGLVELLVKDTQTGNALPLLAFTLQELYERYGKDDRLLEISEYKDKLGGLQGSLAKAAQAILDSYAPPRDSNRKKTEASLRSAFMKLVWIDERGKRARRLASWQKLPSSVHPLLQKLVEGRLLVSSGDEDRQVLEVSHEALLSAWPLLDQWIIDSKKLLLQRQKIEARAEGWKNDQKRPDLLLKGKGLREVESFMKQDGKDLTLNKIGNEFVQASFKQREKFWIKLAVVFGVLSLGGFGWGGTQVWLCCTPDGQIYRVQQELVKPLGRVDDEFVIEASIALGKVGQWKQAFSRFQAHIKNNDYKGIQFLINMADVALKFNKISESSEILEKAVIALQTMEDSSQKASVLSAIAETTGQLKGDDSAQTILEKAIAVAQTIKAPIKEKASTLSAIAKAASQLKDDDSAKTILEKTVAAAQTIDDSTYNSYYKSLVLSAIAEAAGQLTDKDLAKAVLEKTVAVAQTLDSSSNRVSALSSIAEAYGQLKDDDSAKAVLDKAIKVSQTVSNFTRRASALSEITKATGQLKDDDSAKAVLEKTVAVAQTLDSSSDRVSALSSIAEAYGQLKDDDSAKAVLDKAIKAAQTIKVSTSQSSALSTIAEATSQLNDNDSALEVLEKTVAVAQTIKGSAYTNASALCAIAKATGYRKNDDSAKAVLEKTVAVAQTIKDSSYFESLVLITIAEAYGQLKDDDSAKAVLDKAIKVSQTVNSSYFESLVLITIAEAYVQLKDDDSAKAVLDKAIKAAQTIDSTSSKASALSRIAKATGELNDDNLTKAVLEKTVAVAQTIKGSYDKASALSAIAKATGELNDDNLTKAVLEKTVAVAQTLDSSSDRVSVLSATAEAYGKLEKWNDALRIAQKIPEYQEAKKVSVLAKVLTIWAEKHNPKLAIN